MSFSSQIKNFSAKAMDRTEKVVRGTALSMFSRIVLLTPVGNPNEWENAAIWRLHFDVKKEEYVGGRLRANWQVGLNGAPDGELDRKDVGGGSTIGKGNAVIAKHKGDGTIYIANNLPYAQAVEDGSSKQAPAGMVKITVAQFQRIIKGQLK